MSAISHEYYQRWDTTTFLPSRNFDDSWLLRSYTPARFSLKDNPVKSQTLICYQRKIAIKPNRSKGIVRVLRVKILVQGANNRGSVGVKSPGICIKFVGFFLRPPPDGTRSKIYDAAECRLCQTPKRFPTPPCCECTWRGGIVKRRVKKAEADGRVRFPLANSLTLPGKRDVKDGDMAEWSSSRSGDSAETPQWHRLQGTLRGHLTFNQLHWGFDG